MANIASIMPVRDPRDLDAVTKLILTYAATLDDVDLGFQDFDREIAAMPGQYAPPMGELWLARYDSRPAGCVALRPLEEAGLCEMKRLFIMPDRRGSGLGRMLVETVVRKARDIGYREIRLDTLPTMVDALALYRRCGFEAMEAYYETPIEGTVFLRKVL